MAGRMDSATVATPARSFSVADDASSSTGRSVWAFVLGVVALGGPVIAGALVTFPTESWRWPMAALALLTVASNRVKIKIPGHPASVSFAELFVFSSILVYGPAPATVTVAVNGLVQSLMLRDRRLYRTLFNITEPAIATWTAGGIFFAIVGSSTVPSMADPFLPVVAMLGMTIAYFLLDTWLTAVAVALEQDGSARAIWKRHALYLGINYYAAASLALIGVNSSGVMRLEMLGLVVPIMILSYVSYRSAASRLEDSDRHVHEVEHLYQAAVETLAIAVDAKDQVTHGHIRRVQRHTLTVAKAMGVCDQVELKALKAAALLHDVGKLAVPDYVLNKPGALSRAEFDRIKLHANKGAEILSAVDFPYPVVPIVRHHHEHWNGRGYPDGLSGHAIPLGARILSVVDCFDALTSDRPYRRRMQDEEAAGILRERSGSMYDPEVVDAFISLIPELRAGDAAMDVPDADAAGAVAASRVMMPPVRSFHTDDSCSLVSLMSVVGPMLEERLTRQMPEAECCLFAPDSTGDALIAAHATPLVRRAAHSVYIRIGEGLSGWVAANRHTIVNSPPDLELGAAATVLRLRSCMSTPIFALSDLIGVLTVYSTCAEGFSDREVRIVGTLAQEVGLEIARATEGGLNNDNSELTTFNSQPQLPN